MKKNRVELPKLISDKYILLKKATSFGQSSSIKGIYLDKKTKALVFIKINSNGIKLSYEYENQKFFYKKVSKKLSWGIYVPKPIKIIKIGKVWALVMEYIKGETLLKVDSQTQLRIYIKVLKFLKEINTKTYYDKKYTLPIKSAIWQLLTLPYFLFKNLIFYFPHPILFLFSAREIISALPQLMQIKSDWISHGDINVTNILISRNKIILLDFAHSCLNHKYSDMAQMLNSSWRKRGFHDKFLTLLVKEFNLSETRERLLKSFVIFNLMQRLSQKYKNTAQEDFYLKRLESMKTSKITKLQKNLNLVLEQHKFRQTSFIKRDEFNRFNGVVTDSYNKKYFIKVAFGKDSFEYKSLFKEAVVTRNLSNLTKKMNLNLNGYRFYIPAVFKIIAQGEILCLITHFSEGEKLSNTNPSTKKRILLTTLKLLDILSQNTQKNKLQLFLKDYSKASILISLPMRLFNAVTISPRSFPGLTRAFYKTFFLLISDKAEYGLIHPDINLSNIIVQKNKIFLTDWEEAGWGITAYNTITPLCIHWQDKKIRRTLLERLGRLENNITASVLSYRILMLFNQRLSSNDNRRKRDIRLLKVLEAV